jgi:hypothetical protein
MNEPFLKPAKRKIPATDVGKLKKCFHPHYRIVKMTQIVLKYCTSIYLHYFVSQVMPKKRVQQNLQRKLHHKHFGIKNTKTEHFGYIIYFV